jgi:transposase
MKTAYLGIDVSKGYMDVAAINESGSVLRCKGRFDDTYEGHADFSDLVNQMMGGDASKRLVIGIESTGGLERNWLMMMKNNFPDAKRYLLNPLAVKKFGERGLHQNVTDRISALNIAQYLRLGLRPEEISTEPEMEGVLSYYRYIRNEIGRAAEIQNELHSLMMRVHPELAQYCRSGFPNWVLVLMQKFPTAEKLAKAGVGRVSKIPHITPERAGSLIAAAKVSVASQGDSLTARTVKLLCEKILKSLKEIDDMKKELTDYMKDDPVVKVWITFPGIGIWSATALKLEFGAIERFHSSEAAVAYSGLDPCVCQSGDGLKNRGISKRGRRQIRGILYPAMLSAIRHNKVIAEFYSRLRSKGKTHLVAAVACMRKAISVLYAMSLTGKPFDADYQEKLRARIPEKSEAPVEEVSEKARTSYPETPSEDNSEKARAHIPETPVENKSEKAITSYPESIIDDYPADSINIHPKTTGETSPESTGKQQERESGKCPKAANCKLSKPIGCNPSKPANEKNQGIEKGRERSFDGCNPSKPANEKNLPSLNAPISRREAKKRREKLRILTG